MNQGPRPVITGINGATLATTLTEIAIEITGTGFGAAPGSVRLVQGNKRMDATFPLANDALTMVSAPTSALTVS